MANTEFHTLIIYKYILEHMIRYSTTYFPFQQSVGNVALSLKR